MIRIRTEKRVLYMPSEGGADNPHLVQGRCDHVVGMFDLCRDCDFVSVQLETKRLCDKAVERYYESRDQYASRK